MIYKLSDHLKVEPAKLDGLGVFDAYIGVDSLLFIDPQLLQTAAIPEFKNSHNRVREYYKELIILLSASEKKFDKAWMEAWKRLVFRELSGVAIGYGKKNGRGSGIGPALAKRLVESAHEIIRMGIKDPAIFELLGLFEEDFGADRLSDMAIRIVKEDIFAYTQRVSNELGIKTDVEVKVNDRTYHCPGIEGKPLFFLPKELLRELPVALSWEDISKVTQLNEELRRRLNALIAKVWGGKEKPSKKEIKKFLLSSPDDLVALLEAYKRTPSVPYDFEHDPTGLIKWEKVGQQFAFANSLQLSLPKSPTLKQVEEVVTRIIKQFQKNIELNNGKLLLYDKKGEVFKPLHERYAQLLFYSVADAYCQANNLDLSPETNSGSGAVDFKFSQGYILKVLVEVKLSSNKNLLSGLTEQLGAYEQSEGTDSSMYVVVKVTQSSESITKLIKYRDELVKTGKKVPEIFIVDATILPSASKRKLKRSI